MIVQGDRSAMYVSAEALTLSPSTISYPVFHYLHNSFTVVRSSSLNNNCLSSVSGFFERNSCEYRILADVYVYNTSLQCIPTPKVFSSCIQRLAKELRRNTENGRLCRISSLAASVSEVLCRTLLLATFLQHL